MSERDTGLRVTLPLVWRDRYPWKSGRVLYRGDTLVGTVGRAVGTTKWAAWTCNLDPADEWGREIPGLFPTRAEAEAAVERAVMEALRHD